MTISAKVIADSKSATSGQRITTFELEYPRFIHSEFMTHRLFSRNAASSRAIPVKRAIEIIKENTAMPIHWGKNQPGMSAKEECNEIIALKHQRLTKEQAWNQIRNSSLEMASAFDAAGYHKQIVNRMLEPYTHIKVIVTATEYDNFFWLRNHPDAQPEIHELAARATEALNNSTPVSLDVGAWHVPYYGEGFWDNHEDASLEDAIAISASCCAQVSYRRLDDSLEKARDIYQKLVYSMPPHFSPMEHQATPMPKVAGFEVAGTTHLDASGKYWSGNFCNWIQNRQLMMMDLNLAPMKSTPKN